MKTILVDASGDRVTKNGLYVYLFDLAAVAQTCEQVMKQQLGELQYDQSKGIEYLNNVFSGSPNLQLFESQARSELLKIDGVTGIPSFNYDLIGDNLEYSATIETVYGKGDISGTI